MTPIWTGILQLGIWESILLLRYHGMSTVLKLLQKSQEFSIFFAVLCTAVQVVQSIDPSKHLFYQFLSMPVRLGTLILKNVLSSWNPFSVVALSGFVGHSTILPIFTWTPSSSQCYARLKWLTMADRRKFRIILSVYDILHQRSCIDFNTYFTVRITCTRSHSLSLFCRQASINSFRYSFFVNSVFLWNCISHSILSISGRNSFKSQLYSFLFGVAS